jgi:hypothetical protein
MSTQPFYSKFADMFVSVFRREVKTPLTFFFRVVGAIVVLIAVGAFTFGNSADGDAKRFNLIVIGLIMVAVMFMIVVIFAWRSPRNLIYGETAHRAEWKMQFGTERILTSQEEIAALPGLQNRPPNAVQGGS